MLVLARPELFSKEVRSLSVASSLHKRRVNSGITHWTYDSSIGSDMQGSQLIMDAAASKLCKSAFRARISSILFKCRLRIC